MINDEIKALLLAGEDIEYENILIRNYSIGEIFKNIKLDKYNYLITLTILDVEDVIKDRMIDDIENLYDLICTNYEFNIWFKEFLSTFTYLDWEFGKFNDFIANKDGKRIRLTEDKFDDLMSLIKTMYSVNRNKNKVNNDELDPYLAIDEEAKKLAEEFAEFEKENNKNKNKNGITLNGIINGICSKGIGYNLFNIWDLTMYQLMAIYNGIEQLNNYEYIMTSIYSGVYDTKKLKINDIHWCKEIDI